MLKAASIIMGDEGTASTSEMSVNLYQTAQHNNPEDSHFQYTCKLLPLN
jgi:hypothetical protein